MQKEIINKKLVVKERLIEEFNIGQEVADELINDFGIDVIDVIVDKPYILCHYQIKLAVVKGIIEKYYENKNENYKNGHIVAAVIIYAIECLIGFEGHTFIYKFELEEKIVGLREVIKKEELENALEFLKTEMEIVIEYENGVGECIYLVKFYKAEVEMANLISHFLKGNRDYTFDINKINEFIHGYNSADIRLNKLQQEAVKMALSNRISIITGVAGGGKTTAIKAIVEGFKYLNANIDIQICSFTGKAVERMSSITGIQGSTIHRLLGIGVGERNKFSRIKADVIIIDEAGTLGVELFRILLSKFLHDSNSNIKIVIVGDRFQLPSIAPGSVLAEILKSGIVPVVSLTDVVRQEKGFIISNSQKILKGIGISGKKSGIWLKKREFEFIETEKIKEEVSKKVDKLLSDGISIYDIQVISPMKNGDNGVIELNKEIADRFNSIQKREVCKFGILDSVIVIKNNYKKSMPVFNGQKGFIKLVEKIHNRVELITIDFGSRDATFKGKRIEDYIELAYVLTIHKMQGSEAKHVIVVIDKEHEGMLNRELIYVAVTRGIECVTIIGNKEVFNEAVKRVSKERHSLLAERLIGMNTAS